MDLGVYARVIWRFRLVVVVGFILAVTLAILSMAKISPSGLTYRQSELYQSTTRLGVTQNGFPWGRLFATEPSKDGAAVPMTPAQQAEKLGIPIADPNRFNNLAILYAELATSDPVKRLMLQDGPIKGQISAVPVVVQQNIVLPFIDLTAVADTPRGAIALARRSADALESYIRDQQKANNVPDTDRVVIQDVLEPKKVTVFQPRSKTMSIVIFLAVMFATVGLAFLLENLRPRPPARGETAEPQPEFHPARRTA
jgi:capsular polysaccharide biosynthesis protein